MMATVQDFDTFGQFYANDWNNYDGDGDDLRYDRFENEYVKFHRSPFMKKKWNNYPRIAHRRRYQESNFGFQGESDDLHKSKLSYFLRPNDDFIPRREIHESPLFRKQKPWNNHFKRIPHHFGKQKKDWNPFLERNHLRRKHRPSFENGFDKKRELPAPHNSYNFENKAREYQNYFPTVKSEVSDHTSQDGEAFTSVSIGMFSLFSLMCVPLLIAFFWYIWKKFKNKKQIKHKIKKRSERKKQSEISEFKAEEKVSSYKFNVLREKIENQLKAGNFNIELKYSQNDQLNAYEGNRMDEQTFNIKSNLQPQGFIDVDEAERRFSASYKPNPFSLKETDVAEPHMSAGDSMNPYNFEESSYTVEPNFSERNISNPFSFENDDAIGDTFCAPGKSSLKSFKKNQRNERQFAIDVDSHDFEEVVINDQKFVGQDKPFGLERDRMFERNYLIQDKPVPHKLKRIGKNEPNLTIFANLNPYNFEELGQIGKNCVGSSAEDDISDKRLLTQTKSYSKKLKKNVVNDQHFIAETSPINVEEIDTLAKRLAKGRNFTTHVNMYPSDSKNFRNESACFEENELNPSSFADYTEEFGVNKQRISAQNKMDRSVPNYETSFADHFDQVYNRQNLHNLPQIDMLAYNGYLASNYSSTYDESCCNLSHESAKFGCLTLSSTLYSKNAGGHLSNYGEINKAETKFPTEEMT
ncbi:hypothetical protein HNY73_007140 [Argiope bruennichi]|uniref:Uncharacterized protein n=1 Tax=Argiope bruennichi TaxID=94029 RepID=A0A8T0FG27_ARGBR|nr:hypothetical protein HNY73_007140 [Argiope bruennichi]